AETAREGEDEEPDRQQRRRSEATALPHNPPPLLTVREWPGAGWAGGRFAGPLPVILERTGGRGKLFPDLASLGRPRIIGRSWQASQPRRRAEPRRVRWPTNPPSCSSTP